MQRLINTASYIDRFWEKKGRHIPNFEIDIKSDLYIAKGYSESISRFKNLIYPP